MVLGLGDLTVDLEVKVSNTGNNYSTIYHLAKGDIYMLQGLKFIYTRGYVYLNIAYAC